MHLMSLEHKTLKVSEVLYGEMTTTGLIPAYNEGERIQKVIAEVLPFTDEVLVVDDGSEDETASVSRKAGATVLTQSHQGYIHALKRGFQAAQGDIIVTLDADGEHDPSEIPKLVAPLTQGKADLVLGSRKHIPSVSERFFGKIVKARITVHDHGTGFRALTKELAVTLGLKGKCTCGIFVLEAVSKGARIAEVPITIRETKKRRKRKWMHIVQVFYVFLQFFRSMNVECDSQVALEV